MAKKILADEIMSDDELDVVVGGANSYGQKSIEDSDAQARKILKDAMKQFPNNPGGTPADSQPATPITDLAR